MASSGSRTAQAADRPNLYQAEARRRKLVEQLAQAHRDQFNTEGVLAGLQFELQQIESAQALTPPESVASAPPGEPSIANPGEPTEGSVADSIGEFIAEVSYLLQGNPAYATIPRVKLQELFSQLTEELDDLVRADPITVESDEESDIPPSAGDIQPPASGHQDQPSGPVHRQRAHRSEGPRIFEPRLEDRPLTTKELLVHAEQEAGVSLALPQEKAERHSLQH
jgi:hypothetical protein